MNDDPEHVHLTRADLLRRRTQALERLARWSRGDVILLRDIDHLLGWPPPEQDTELADDHLARVVDERMSRDTGRRIPLEEVERELKVIEVTEEELRGRQDRALAAVGLEHEELKLRVRSGQATPEEHDAWREVEAVRFLLRCG